MGLHVQRKVISDQYAELHSFCLCIASDLGAKVAVLDYVSPSTQGLSSLLFLNSFSLTHTLSLSHTLISFWIRHNELPQEHLGVLVGLVSMLDASQRSCFTRLVC